MLRKRGIQIQIIVTIVVALLLLAAALQVVQGVRQRNTLLDAKREQSLAIAGSLQESMKAFDVFMTQVSAPERTSDSLNMASLVSIMFAQFEDGFTSFVAANPNVAFEALVFSNTNIIAHSDPTYKGKPIEALNLHDVPLDKTVRRDVPGYGAVYLTRAAAQPISQAPELQLDFIVGIPADPIDQALWEGLLSSAGVALGAIVLVGLAAVMIVRRSVIHPVRQLQHGTRALGEGQLDFRIMPSGGREMVELAETFNRMAVELEQSREMVDALFHNMEARVQYHARDLEIAAEIGRIATSIRDIDVLLREMVGQIRRRFDTVYHVQIFMLDNLGEYAVLTESTGEAGRQLLEFGHKLRVGSNSLIGRVTARGQVVIASDTSKPDVSWQPNPFLPSTRSEMGLPLKIEDRVFGALDLQSTESDAFDEDVVRVFEVLSDQIAIAIENARLLAETQERVQEINTLNRQLTRSAWQSHDAEHGGTIPTGYVYDQLRVEPLGNGQLVLSGDQTETPIQVRGETIGTLVVDMPGYRELTDDDYILMETLAGRVGLAVENARLFEEAQTETRRAQALAEAGQLAGQIGSDFESGLQHLFKTVSGPGNYDRWWFGLLTGDGVRIQRVVASHTDWPDHVDVQAPMALTEAVQRGKMIIVNQVNDQPSTGALDETIQYYGKHLAMPVRLGSDIVGVLQIGRAFDAPDIDERDVQLVATLSSQVAVATENRRLFDQAESQRQELQIIVDTMPTGIMVATPTGDVMLSNQRLLELVGPLAQAEDAAQVSASYPIVHSDTGMAYSSQEWPLTRVFSTGEPVLVDDLIVIHPDGSRISLLANVAPIRDRDGNITAAVGAFQDISDLQELERALQDSLRETTLLYEASRSISHVSDMSELLKVMLWQLDVLFPDAAYIILRNDDFEGHETMYIAASQPSELKDTCNVSVFQPLLTQEMRIPDANQPDDAEAACLNALELAAISSFPLGVRGEAVGWLVVGYKQPRVFSVEERRLLSTLTDQAAITIENQRLLARTEDALQDTAALYYISRAIANAQAAQDVLMAFIQHAELLDVSQGLLYLLHAEVPDMSYAAVEVMASWSAHQADDLSGTRYSTRQFPLWSVMMSPDITWIDDITTAPTLDDDAKQALEALAIRAAIFIPLKSAGRSLGMVLLGFPRHLSLNTGSKRLYESLADQAATSLENMLLFQQAQRRARQLSISAEISRAVTTILRLDELLSQVINMIRDAFEYDHVQVFLVNDENARADLVASTGEAGQQLLSIRHHLLVGSDSVIGQVTQKGEPQIALDTADAKIVHKFNPYLPNTRSEMALPLITRGQIVGALDVQSNQPGAFTDDDANALRSLADLVATAIDNARLFEVSEQRADEMAFLFSVTTAAATAIDLDETLDQVVNTLRGTMNLTSASIFLPDASGEYMVKGADVGAVGAETDLSSIELDRGLIGWVARHNEAVIIDDLSNDPRRLPSNKNTRSVIAVPLQAVGVLVGVLVGESNEVNAFDENDLRLLQTLSSSLAAIIENSRLLREIQDANVRLLEVDHLKTNFLAAMSHELRTPLNSIIGFSRVILKGIDGPLTDAQEEDLQTIYDSGRHLLGLVNDILDQAKIEAGKMELSFAYFKLQEVIKGVMSSAVGLSREKSLRLYTEIADDLPDAYGDEFRTRQVLLNLVSNASKFTNEGSVTLTAFPTTEEGQPVIHVSVSDTGIGIAEEDMPLLFEAFQQVDNSLTRRVEGTGMGLPLAKSLTELQGGRIWVESEVGVGSTFSISIPVSPPPEEDAVEPDEGGASDDVHEEYSDQPVEESAPAPPASRIVLVVEEQVKAIDLYRKYLAREGYEVIGVTRLEDAEELAVAYQPRVILLDVAMHEQQGWDLLAHLKDAEPTFRTPIIVCSIDADMERGYRLGASNYLIKPFTREQLVTAVQQAEAEATRQRILLVDDKPETIRVFREMLETFGTYEVLQVTTGQQALDIIQQTASPIDLVILDLRMPEIDGFEVLKAMRSNNRTARIPVLVLTAEDISAEERDSLQHVDVYRKDDVDEHHLLNQVEIQLGNHQEKR
ncbi:MAG: GAF domain-containing protein [Anaerolineae bacterium]|nr:GAF domain-containing protein [Anaerolineae bacterium]